MSDLKPEDMSFYRLSLPGEPDIDEVGALEHDLWIYGYYCKRLMKIFPDVSVKIIGSCVTELREMQAKAERLGNKKPAR